MNEIDKYDEDNILVPILGGCETISSWERTQLGFVKESKECLTAGISKLVKEEEMKKLLGYENETLKKHISKFKKSIREKTMWN